MKLKHLKIVEQIIIISLIGVLFPSVISWLIINNISQHSIRQQLANSAQNLAGIIENNIFFIVNSDEDRLNEIVTGLNHVHGDENQRLYLKDIAINSHTFKEFEIIHPSEHPEFNTNTRIINSSKGKILLLKKVHDDKYIKAEINTKPIEDSIFKDLEDIKYRRIYVVNNDGNLILSHNFDKNDYENCIKQLPKNLVNNVVTRFEKIKNQPRVYLKIKDLDLIVIVNTSKELTDKTINKAKMKIIVSFLIAVMVTLLLTLLYSYYLYFNIKQLFRGIIAVSRGNYMRPISLKTNILTPREIIFLADEFNSMINEINNSYTKLEQKNKELKQLDSFRSNLVDTVSHELRTPLTGIKGYTSRLLRTDIVIDEETKHKSLLIIKQQAERLSRMIEDLLVIPDIEGAKLNIRIESVNLLECIEKALYSVKNIEDREIENNITNDFPLILADKDRLEQVLINLISNSHKYAYKNTPIKINAVQINDNAEITVSNYADYIKLEILNTLFDKFIRLDDKTTRTTRGTGLGLYIVKGLVEAMNGKVEIFSSVDNIFTVKVILKIWNNDNRSVL